MAAIVGAAGLAPCLAAARAGKRLLLANKEALVVGGALFMQAVREGGATLLPIDSEHSAIFQCLPEDRAHLGTSASTTSCSPRRAGRFAAATRRRLRDVTPDEACAHPNWVMGRKISVDSATMMNKALEVIEARWLFDLAPEQIEVVIHPQSIIHSMVVCRDNSVLAQLGTPDMRVPIAYGLAFPERIASGAEPLDFAHARGAQLRAAPTMRRFPGLAWPGTRCARPPGSDGGAQRGQRGGGGGVPRRNRSASTRFTRSTPHHRRACCPSAGAADSLEALLALDAEARRRAAERLSGSSNELAACMITPSSPSSSRSAC